MITAAHVQTPCAKSFTSTKTVWPGTAAATKQVHTHPEHGSKYRHDIHANGLLCETIRMLAFVMLNRLKSCWCQEMLT